MNGTEDKERRQPFVVAVSAEQGESIHPETTHQHSDVADLSVQVCFQKTTSDRQTTEVPGNTQALQIDRPVGQLEDVTAEPVQAKFLNRCR